MRSRKTQMYGVPKLNSAFELFDQLGHALRKWIENEIDFIGQNINEDDNEQLTDSEFTSD